MSDAFFKLLECSPLYLPDAFSSKPKSRADLIESKFFAIIASDAIPQAQDILFLFVEQRTFEYLHELLFGLGMKYRRICLGSVTSFDEIADHP